MSERLPTTYGPAQEANTIGANIDPELARQLQEIAAQNQPEVSDNLAQTPSEDNVENTGEPASDSQNNDTTVAESVDTADEPSAKAEKTVEEWLNEIGERVFSEGVLSKASGLVAQRNAAEGENFKPWPAYKDALIKLGAIDEDTDISPHEVKLVVQRARQLSKSVDARKKEIVTKLGESPDIMVAIRKAVGKARYEYKSKHGTLDGFDSAPTIAHIMKNPNTGLVSDDTSETDAFFSPTDMRGVYYKVLNSQEVRPVKKSIPVKFAEAPSQAQLDELDVKTDVNELESGNPDTVKAASDAAKAERAAKQNQSAESSNEPSNSETPQNPSPEAAPEKLTVAEQEARWMESVMDYGAHTHDNERRKRVSEEYAKLQELKEQEKNVDIEALQAEWMGVIGQYGKLMDKSSPEARELVRKASTLYAEISTAEAAEALKAERADLPDITLPEEATKEYPDLPDIQLPDDVDGPKANGIETPISDHFRSVQERVRQEALEKERLDQIQEKIATLRGELESDYVYGEGLRQAMSHYAELKADSETKMGDVKIFGLSIWEGRSKREKHLRAADTALLTAKLAFEKELIRRAKEAGLYDGDEAQIAQTTSDDLFNALRNLDSETREATNNVLDQRKEERGPIKKTIAAIGNFLTKGKKVTQNVKTIGSGVAVGVIAGVTTTISGIGWPITTALIGGGTALVRGATKMANLDTIRGENKDADGNAYRVMSDEEADAIKRSGAEAGISSEERAKYVAQMILDRSRERGYEQVDRAQKDANKRAFKFAMGAVAATAATGAVVWSRGAAASALESIDRPNPIDVDIHKGGAVGSEIGNQSLDAPRDLVPDYDFPQGANVITRGEGWVNQYMDMGMSNKEAWALFHDKDLMSELVKLKAAYVDNSANIGGYGINMPENGHLSKAVMEAIGKAKLAKGF